MLFKIKSGFSWYFTFFSLTDPNGISDLVYIPTEGDLVIGEIYILYVLIEKNNRRQAMDKAHQ